VAKRGGGEIRGVRALEGGSSRVELSSTGCSGVELAFYRGRAGRGGGNER
jgi:hypothetical protein